MKLSAKGLARMIDISAVRTPHGEREIREMVENAKEYRFIAVHVLPCWVPFLRELLASEPDIMVGAPVGFPSGAHWTEIKVAEAKALVKMIVGHGLVISALANHPKARLCGAPTARTPTRSAMQRRKRRSASARSA